LADYKFERQWRLNMTEPIKSGLISRRKAFLLMAAALGVAVPVSMLAVAEAEAQTAGMERRTWN
jgi:hypothetical protein